MDAGESIGTDVIRAGIPPAGLLEIPQPARARFSRSAVVIASRGPTLVSTWRALRTGTLSMAVLVVLSVGTAYFFSVGSTFFFKEGGQFFEAAVVLLST